jgi:hypothetical protein
MFTRCLLDFFCQAFGPHSQTRGWRRASQSSVSISQLRVAADHCGSRRHAEGRFEHTRRVRNPRIKLVVGRALVQHSAQRNGGSVSPERYLDTRRLRRLSWSQRIHP